jgi:hypothetical protein
MALKRQATPAASTIAAAPIRRHDRRARRASYEDRLGEVIKRAPSGMPQSPTAAIPEPGDDDLGD